MIKWEVWHNSCLMVGKQRVGKQPGPWNMNSMFPTDGTCKRSAWLWIILLLRVRRGRGDLSLFSICLKILSCDICQERQLVVLKTGRNSFKCQYSSLVFYTCRVFVSNQCTCNTEPGILLYIASGIGYVWCHTNLLTLTYLFFAFCYIATTNFNLFHLDFI